MALSIVQVDAFTAVPFAGNPAAVCVLREPREAAWMQNVAREMNLSETAFLDPRSDGFNLRWFTPVLEVDLCGHATLASAHVLWEEGHLKAGRQARFFTRSGWLAAERRGDWIELDFPATPESSGGIAPQPRWNRWVRRKHVGRSKFDYMVELESEEAVRGLKPDFTRLGRVTTRGIIVTSRSSSSEFDFVSRFFAPGAGLDEDPVTGSAHACLGPYWCARLGKTNCWRTRLRLAGAWCACEWGENACTWPGRR